MDDGDFVKDLERQWIEQVERIKNQTTVQRLQTINEQIETFEMLYGGTFQDLFGHLSELEIDGLSEAVDISDWRELLDQRQRLLDMTLRTERIRIVKDKAFDDCFPDGVFAVPPSPNEPRLKIRKLVEYCRSCGIPLSEIHRLSAKEMKQFFEYPNNDRAQGESDQD